MKCARGIIIQSLRSFKICIAGSVQFLHFNVIFLVSSRHNCLNGEGNTIIGVFLLCVCVCFCVCVLHWHTSTILQALIMTPLLILLDNGLTDHISLVLPFYAECKARKHQHHCPLFFVMTRPGSEPTTTHRQIKLNHCSTEEESHSNMTNGISYWDYILEHTRGFTFVHKH